MGTAVKAPAFSETPIYGGLLAETIKAQAAAFIAELSPKPCPACGIRLGACRTAGGNPARRPHAGRES